MKQMKRLLLVFAAGAIITTGVTLAFLKDITNSAVNTFSSDRKLSLLLREPAWDGYEFNDVYANGIKPGEMAKPGYENSSDLGIIKASNYYPNDIINKNPILKNDSDRNEAEIVAIKVQYIIIDSDGKEYSLTKKEFKEKYAVMISNQDSNKDGIHDAFVNISNTDQFDIYMLGNKAEPKILAAGTTTAHLFDSIQINKDIKADDKGKLPNFQIKVTGLAVQSNLDASTAIIELCELAN